MVDYIAFFPAKIERAMTEKEPFIYYAEFFDGGKVLVEGKEVGKEGDLIIIGRKLLSQNPLITKDEISKLLTKKDELIFKEMKERFETTQIKAKQIVEREPSGIG